METSLSIKKMKKKPAASRTPSAVAWLREIPKKNAGRVFLVDSFTGKEWTYDQIHQDASRIGAWLNQNGLQKGDRLALLLLNSAEFARLYLGCLYAGVVVIPINPILSEAEISFILNDGKIRTTVVSSKTENKLSLGVCNKNKIKTIFLSLGGDPSSDPRHSNTLDLNALLDAKKFVPFHGLKDNDELIIVYTSGTTADPKGVVHKVADLVNNGRLFGKLLGLSSKNRFYNNLALTYLGGYYNLLLLPYVNGSSVVVSETYNPASVISFWKPIIKHEVNTLWLVASLMAILLEMDRSTEGEKYCREKMRHILAGMAPLPVALRHKFEKRYGLPVYENYGLSETLFIATNTPQAAIRDGSVGKIVPGVQVKILNEDGKNSTSGEEGEIWVKTPYLMRGYQQDLGQGSPSLSASHFFPTGDLGLLDRTQYLRITGRKKDLIIRGGINISPASVEDVLHQHPAIHECAVLGVPHPILGEEVAAVIRITRDAVFEKVRNELLELCRTKLARIKQPSQIIELPEFPHTTSGKIQKRKIRTWLCQKTEILQPLTDKQTPKSSAQEDKIHFTPSKVVSDSAEAMSIKFNTMVYELQRQKIDVTVLSLGEAFFEIPLYDFHSLPLSKIYHYSHSRGIFELREAIAKYFKEEYDVTFDPEKEIIVTAGSKVAIHMTLMSILNPGDEVMVYEPAWVSYPEQIKLCYGVPVSIPFDEKITNFERYVTNRTKMIIINNPNNPSGRVFNLDELAYLYSLARKHNLFVLSDEAYSDFVINSEEFISLANLDIELKHTIVVNSLSKNFGMSGWRLGYVITNPSLILQILKVNQHLITCPSTILEYYSAKYFQNIVNVTKPQIKAVVEKRAEVQKYMTQVGLETLAGSSTFYFFVSIGKSKLNSEAFATELLQKHHICVVPGIGYGKSCGRFVRVSVGSESMPRIQKALNTIKQFIDQTSV